METFHLKDYTVQTLDFKAQLNFSVFNPRFEQAQRMLGEHILTASRSRMPIRTGALQQLSHTEDGGRRIVFPGPYARFQWGGKVMVDPETGSPWARKGVKKVLTDRPLTYGDPNAVDHWTDQAWAEQGNAIIKAIRRILEGENGESQSGG